MPRPKTSPETIAALTADLAAGVPQQEARARHHVGMRVVSELARQFDPSPKIQAALEAGDSDYQIARALGVTRARVANQRREAGIEPVKRRGRKKI